MKLATDPTGLDRICEIDLSFSLSSRTQTIFTPFPTWHNGVDEDEFSSLFASTTKKRPSPLFTTQITAITLNMYLSRVKFESSTCWPGPANPQGDSQMDLDYPDLFQLRANPIWQHQLIAKETEILQANGSPNLDNPVHHLWRWKAFRDFSFDQLEDWNLRQYDYTPEFYQRIYPALQIATIYLERATPFMVRLLRAPILLDPFGEEYFDPHWQPTNVDMAHLNQALNTLAYHYRILHRKPLLDRTGSTHHGPGRVASFGLQDEEWAWGSTTVEYYTNGLPRDMTSAIAAEVLHEFDADSWNEKNDYQKATMLVMLAMILIHELAHSLFGVRRLEIGQGHPPHIADAIIYADEPMMWPERWNELGQSLEIFLCGGYISYGYGQYLTRWDIEAGLTHPQRIGPIFDGTLGLYAILSNQQSRIHGASRRPLSVHTVFSFFDKQTWTAQQQKLHLINIEGTGGVFPVDMPITIRPGTPGIREPPQLMRQMNEANRARQT